MRNILLASLGLILFTLGMKAGVQLEGNTRFNEAVWESVKNKPNAADLFLIRKTGFARPLKTETL